MSRFKIAFPVLPVVLILLAAVARPSAGQVESVPISTRPTEGAWKHDWSKGAVFYEVFVRSFRDSDRDGIGDLRGLIEKLDYLNDGKPETTTDLGVDALWLMPVFESPSYHGYDTVDYEQIEKDYGTNQDFYLLAEECRKRGIRIILDLVLNHSGEGHPWFVESATNERSPRRNWYVWSPIDLGWKQPWNIYTGSNTWHSRNGAYYYGVFWGGMPDLNYMNPAVRENAKQMASLWLDRGASGFRLDATRYLIETSGGAGQADTAETHALLKEFAGHVRRVRPDATIVAENWTETKNIAPYYGSTAKIPEGDEIPMNFNFPLGEEIINGVNGGDSGAIARKFAEMASLYPKGVNDAPFLTNHDGTRLATRLGGNVARMKNAAALLLTVPGAPFIYYGEEVGILNGNGGGDEYKRTPMPWNDTTSGGGFTEGSPWFGFSPGRDVANVATQTNDANSLLSRYRSLIQARKKSEALSKGAIEVLSASSSPTRLLIFLRTLGTERVLVAHNVSDGYASAGPLNLTYTSTERLFADSAVNDPSGLSGAIQVSLPPRATGIWRLKN
jgi:glycosidase